MSRMWFKPKRYGYGAGFPMAWEGWALLLGYAVAMLIVASFVSTLSGQRTLVGFGIGAAITILLCIVIREKTEGGWRWRWGDDD